AKQLSDGRASLPVLGLGSLDTPATREALRTRAGDVIGTPAFMPPEQASGEPVDERGDVYALGALLRYVIAGRLTTPNEEIDAPPALAAVCKRALALLPEHRYANAGELVVALREATGKKRDGGRWIWIAAGALAVIALVLVWRLTRSGAAHAD